MFTFLSDFFFQPGFSLIESCHTNASVHLILAECIYTSNSIVAGFQVIAQLSDSSQVHKLFSSKAVSPQTSVAIPVEENGMYQVTIIGIRRGTGIVESGVEHVVMLVVTDTPIIHVTSKYILYSHYVAIQIFFWV